MPAEPGSERDRPVEVVPIVPPVTVAAPDDAGLASAADVFTVQVVADADSMAPLPDRCPAARPKAGDPCALPDSGVLECEYGGDAHGACRTLADCESGHWSIGQEVCPTDPSACPATYGQGEGASCPVTGFCDYEQGRCSCVGCVLDADGGIESGSWHCRPWPVDAGAGCPAEAPLTGSACSTEGQSCGADCCGSPRVSFGEQCSAGVWEPIVCPTECLQMKDLGCY